MKALMGFEPAHNGNRMDFLLAVTLPTELSMLTTYHIWLLNMPPKCFDFNVYKQAHVNIHVAIRSWENYSDYLMYTLANSVNPDEMPHHATFHQGLHYLLFRERNAFYLGIITFDTSI